MSLFSSTFYCFWVDLCFKVVSTTALKHRFVYKSIYDNYFISAFQYKCD